jgi:hypothetical protein
MNKILNIIAICLSLMMLTLFVSLSYYFSAIIEFQDKLGQKIFSFDTFTTDIADIRIGFKLSIVLALTSIFFLSYSIYNVKQSKKHRNTEGCNF